MKRILIIDDEPEIRRYISALLRCLDYHPIEAENGRQGVELAKREKPDLILCEVAMPELDGHGVLRALQQDADLAFIPFIFLKTKGEMESLRSGKDLGPDGSLTDFLADSEVVRAIEARLRGSRRRAKRKFKPDFSSAKPLKAFNLTARAAEALLWLAQGKTNRDIATILGISESTVKKHVQEIFAKLGVETRSAATVRALEVLGSPSRRPSKTAPELRLDFRNLLRNLPPG